MKNRVVVAVLLALSLSGRARAQDSSDKNAAVLEEARQHVAKAKVHYDLGEFKQAADEYILVYRLRPIPAVLFNIAQAYRQGGEYERARQFYKSYLRDSPNTKDKKRIEQDIKEMGELLAKEKKTRDAGPTGVTQPPEDSLVIPEEKTASAPRAPAAPPPVIAAAPAQQKPAAVPSTAEPAPSTVATPWASVPVAATSATPQPVVAQGEPLYKKWWLWTAVGAVAVGGAVFAMTSGGNEPPASHFGTQTVFGP